LVALWGSVLLNGMKRWRSYAVLAVTNRKILLKLGWEILIVITFSVERKSSQSRVQVKQILLKW